MISAVILAAGKSIRMGMCKQMTKVGDKTMVRRVVETALGSHIDEVILVLGYEAERVAEEVRELRQEKVKLVFNPNYEEGMSSSIKAGLEAVHKGSDAFLLFLVDLPLVETDVVKKIKEAYEEGGSLIIMPVYKGRTGHPVLFDRSLFPEVMELKGDVGARSVVERHLKDVREVRVETPSILLDIDTPEQLETIERRIRGDGFSP